MIVKRQTKGRSACGLTLPSETANLKTFLLKFVTLADEKHTGLQNTQTLPRPLPPSHNTAHTDLVPRSHRLSVQLFWATFNMPEHFPHVERQTGRLSDCQSAIITFTAAHCSAAPQTPGKLPWPLTFPLEKKKKIRLCKWQLHGARFVDWN